MVDSPDMPFMASRRSTVELFLAFERHAVVVSTDDSVMLVDCDSLNGTWVLGSPEIDTE